MKRLIAFMGLLLTLVECQSPMVENTTELEASKQTRLNKRLVDQALVPSVLMNKITISCKSKSKVVNRALSREEYLTILRDEYLGILPEEMQQQKEALDGMAQLLAQDSIVSLLEAHQDWSLPLPHTYGGGSTWIKIDKQALVENRNQGQAVLQLLKEEKLVGEAEYEAIRLAIDRSSLVFPYQLYDLIMTQLKK